MGRVRLDQELVAQGFFASSDEAARAVMAGLVHTTQRRLDHPGEQVHEGLELHVKGHKRYVSRGGLKLEAALAAFGYELEGARCVDVGCSTGGFSDCLLAHGAAYVLAVDVGYAQFDWRLRNDPRIELMERTNACELPGTGRDASFDIAVMDVSFTSALSLAPAVFALLKDQGSFACLVKPQFEAARDEVGVKGVVADEAVWRRCVCKVAEGLESLGFGVRGLCASPITGAQGNHEFFLDACKGGSSRKLPLDEIMAHSRKL